VKKITLAHRREKTNVGKSRRVEKQFDGCHLGPSVAFAAVWRMPISLQLNQVRGDIAR